MLFGERLAIVRKLKKVSQSELAKKIGKHAPLIGRYERGEVKPSIEVAFDIAKSLEVSLDYLIGITDVELDNNMIKKIQDIENLPEVDKEHIFYTLDGLIKAAKLKTI